MYASPAVRILSSSNQRPTIRSRIARLAKNHLLNEKLEQALESFSKAAAFMKPIIKILLSLRKAPTVPNQKNQNQVKVLRKVGVANRVDAVVHLNPINSHVLSIATFDFLSTLKRTAD